MDTHITLKNASRLLNMPLEEVRGLIRKGLLPSVKINDSVYVSANDVQAIRESIDSDDDILNPTERLVLLSLRVKRLEEKMDRVYKVMEMGAAVSLSTLSDKEMYKMYRSACEQLTKNTWSVEELYKWGTIVLNMDAVQLKRISQLSNNKHPWKILSDLIDVMKDYWKNNLFTEEDPRGREIAYILEKSLKNLKREALFYEKNQLNEPHLMVLKYFNMPKADKVRFFLDLIKN